MKAICLFQSVLLLVLTSCSALPIQRTNAVVGTKALHQSAPTHVGEEPALVFFTSEPGKFQVWLPVSESVQNYTVRKTLLKEAIECPVLAFRLNGAYAAVQYCDLVPRSIVSLSSDEILEETESEILHGLNIKSDTKEKMLVQDTYPALTLSGEVDLRGMGYDGTFKARIILVESRLYLVVMSVYHENWCHCIHQMDQVVDSLYIEPGLAIPFEPVP